jgi:putative protein-disulfide isomerase
LKPLIIYCYDAYCGWCYGFSPVIKSIAQDYQHLADFETLSGGMIPREARQPIGKLAGYILEAYKSVEHATGIKFGEDYLWHLRNPGLSDWFPDSEKPAIAMAVFREFHPDKTIEFAADLQYALHFEGRDLTDDEAYRHLLPKYSIPEEIFYMHLHENVYREKAHYDFALVKQLQVGGFPAVLMQTGDLKFYLLSRGYTDFETLKLRIEKVLQEIEKTEEGPGTITIP